MGGQGPGQVDPRPADAKLAFQHMGPDGSSPGPLLSVVVLCSCSQRKRQRLTNMEKPGQLAILPATQPADWYEGWMPEKSAASERITPVRELLRASAPVDARNAKCYTGGAATSAWYRAAVPKCQRTAPYSRA